ncbi:hypothetical protein SCLCIDRAFT_1215742 [Scleroderma citrinum Foug A]|uniref:Uncharacterized protein n=1 Tax=Scleroderma citrinum Foug A TaxID=1036808 RepID=A0A0C3DLZ2_9AGAM|nr:hypothetical protein SCLCIDRAFT_1215742 [Scleroderma citrinum Foug A]
MRTPRDKPIGPQSDSDLSAYLSFITYSGYYYKAGSYTCLPLDFSCPFGGGMERDSIDRIRTSNTTNRSQRHADASKVRGGNEVDHCGNLSLGQWGWGMPWAIRDSAG